MKLLIHLGLDDQIQEYLKVYPMDETPNVRHYRFCFNVNDEILDIICNDNFKIICDY
jgi:hypothetical protein